MSLSIKFWIFSFLIVLCLLSAIECKEKPKKKSNSTQKVKKINTTAKKLVTTTKSVLSVTTAKPLRSLKAKRSNIKSSKKSSLLGSKVSKNSKQNQIESKQNSLPSKPIINISNGLNDDQREKALQIVSEVLENRNKNNSALVECIRTELDRELGLTTNVILSSTPLMEQSLSKIPGTVIMQLNTIMPNDDNQVMTISVFGLRRETEFLERSNNLMKSAQKLSPKIIDSLMSTDMRQEIQKMATKVVRNAKNMVELSDQLSEVINDRFGPHWHAVVGHKHMMTVDNHRKASIFFLDMDFGDMRVSVFK